MIELGRPSRERFYLILRDVYHAAKHDDLGDRTLRRSGAHLPFWYVPGLLLVHPRTAVCFRRRMKYVDD